VFFSYLTARNHDFVLTVYKALCDVAANLRFSNSFDPTRESFVESQGRSAIVLPNILRRCSDANCSRRLEQTGIMNA
jgi:hypothetical protein